MSNIIPFDQGTNGVPAHLADLFGDEGNIAPRATINQLSYKGKVWRTVIDGEETKLLRKDPDTGDMLPMQVVNLVILDHNKARSRAYYEGDFVDGEAKAPRCASSDGVKPDADIKDPIAATCASCPNAVKGSKITDNGKQSTLCAANKRIVVVPSGGAITRVPPMLLRLAQTSIWDKDNTYESQGWYAWDQYLDMLRARGAKHTAAVETRVKFDPDKPYPKLLFSASRWLNPEEAVAAKKVMAENAEVIGKLLTRSSEDGSAQPSGIPAEGVDGSDNAAAQAAAAEAAAKAAAEAKAKAEAEAKAKKAAEAKAKKEAEAKAKAEAEAAAKAAASSPAGAFGGDDGDAFGGAFGGEPEPAKSTSAPAQTEPAKTGVVEEAGTPAALADLLNSWDDE